MNKAITDTPQVIVFHTGGGASTRTWDSSLPDTWDSALYTWDEDVGAGTTEVIVSSVVRESINATASQA